jgi:hypothetical protein
MTSSGKAGGVVKSYIGLIRIYKIWMDGWIFVVRYTNFSNKSQEGEYLWEVWALL